MKEGLDKREPFRVNVFSLKTCHICAKMDKRVAGNSLRSSKGENLIIRNLAGNIQATESNWVVDSKQ